MNKNGFTLVELLAVIIILSILTVLAGTSVGSVVKDSKEDLYQAQISNIKEAARAWYIDNTDYYLNYYDCAYITLKDLKNYGLIDSSTIDPKTEKKFSNNMKIKISLNNSKKYGTTKINYEVDPNNLDNCVYFNRTTCTLSNDSIEKGTEVGAKYECEVKPGVMYNFYVLSSNDDETVNLIMDQNINSDGTLAGNTRILSSSLENEIYNKVAWVSQEDYKDNENWNNQIRNNKGPITALTFLYNATKDWSNIDPVNYTYNDKITQETTAENTSYTLFVSVNGVATIISLDESTSVTIGTIDKPLRARMPIYSSDTTITEVTNKANAPYLYENLDYNGDSLSYGYWTLSSSAKLSYTAYEVNYQGFVGQGGVGVDIYDGIRPVITLPKTELSENN